MAKIKRGFFFTDVHLPYEDRRTLAAVEHYLRDNTFDYMICGGDLLDFDVISAHNKDNLRAVGGKTIKRQYDAGNKFLDRWQNLQPNAWWTLIEGNHDYRVERYIDAHPEGQGMLEVPVGLRLAERGIEWVPFWSSGQVKKIGKATFIHGLYTNDHHCKKHALAFGCNLFLGHAHDVASYSVARLGDNNTFTAQSCGCLCAYPQSYLRGRPTKWQQAFAEFWFREDGYFNYCVVQIFANRFVAPNGKLYTPRG